MTKRDPSVENVLAVLPQVQEAVRREIAARKAAGEEIVSAETPAIRRILDRRRAELDALDAERETNRRAGKADGRARRKSAA